jgi:hypothetical protein
MTMNSDVYRTTEPDELQQGDICFAPIARLQSSTPPRAPVWEPLDQVALPVDSMSQHEPALTAHVGYTAVMVTTHDCQMDKEAQALYARLRRQRPPLAKTEAVARAEEDPELDRFVTVVPLVPVDWLRTGEQHLLSGDTTGYFPVPAWVERGIIGGVADLTCPTTIDRHLLIRRMASLTDDARGRLRLALARLSAFRSPEIGFEIEAAVGRRIIGVHRVGHSPLEIVLELETGSDVRLILQPEPPRPKRPARRAPRTTSADSS